MAPHTPQRSGRPGEAVAPLDSASRGRGPEMAPHAPNARAAPAKPWRPSILRRVAGAPKWPRRCALEVLLAPSGSPSGCG